MIGNRKVLVHDLRKSPKPGENRLTAILSWKSSSRPWNSNPACPDRMPSLYHLRHLSLITQKSFKSKIILSSPGVFSLFSIVTFKNSWVNTTTISLLVRHTDSLQLATLFYLSRSCFCPSYFLSPPPPPLFFFSFTIFFLSYECSTHIFSGAIGEN